MPPPQAAAPLAGGPGWQGAYGGGAQAPADTWNRGAAQGPSWDEPQPGEYGNAPRVQSRGMQPEQDRWQSEAPEPPARPSRSRGRGKKGGGLNFGGMDDGGGEPRGQHGGESTRAVAEISLLNLCTPVFAFANFLPESMNDPQPDPGAARHRVLTELRRIELEASRYGIDPMDAREAVYALCLFIDEAVRSSGWIGREQWAADPLHIAILNDPHGGVHFFQKLAQFGERQADLKSVYLTCLAMGYRGMYAEYEETAQAAQVMQVRTDVFASLRQVPMQRRKELFPEAYRGARPLNVRVPSGRLSWKLYSVVACAAAGALIFLMWVNARVSFGNTRDDIKNESARLKAAVESFEDRASEAQP